jgi:hypothetical protein
MRRPDVLYDRDGNVMPMDYYKDRNNRFCTDRRIGRTIVGDVLVSTVWLSGIDHGWGDDPILLFETMTFGGRQDQCLQRYATEEEAMRGHLDVVDRLRAGELAFPDQDVETDNAHE